MIQALIIPTIAMLMAWVFGVWVLLRLRPKKGY